MTIKTRRDWVSGNTLTITPLDSEANLEEVTAEFVDDDPADILNCSSVQVERREAVHLTGASGRVNNVGAQGDASSPARTRLPFREYSSHNAGD